LIAYVARYMSFGVKNISASLEQVDTSLEEVARISGASWIRSFFDVVIPLIRPGIIAAWFLAFMPILRELTMSVLLYGPNTKTIGVTVFELQEGGYYTKSAAMATLILVIIVSGNLILNLLAKKLGNHSVSGVNK
jgi:iron(III) transport system permease protein